MKSPGAAYPDDVLQKIASELAILHTLRTSGIADELDPSPSFELWLEVEHFVLYVIECAIRTDERLHPSSKSRLTHLLIEKWSASRKPFPNPSSGIVARTIVSLVIKTGLNAQLFQDGYGQIRTVYDSFLNSTYRKSDLKDLSDLTALAAFFPLRVLKGRMQEGQPGWTRTKSDALLAHVSNCYATTAQTIQLLSIC